jgi:hypothetical protein
MNLTLVRHAQLDERIDECMNDLSLHEIDVAYRYAFSGVHKRVDTRMDGWSAEIGDSLDKSYSQCGIHNTNLVSGLGTCSSSYHCYKGVHD